MLEITLILILVVVAMVAIIVNRKSLIACFVITIISSLLGMGFLILYSNADKFSSHRHLVMFTITVSMLIIFALIAVTYIGVKMRSRKQLFKKRYVPAPPQEAVGEPMLIPGTNVYAKAVGIFGRKELAATVENSSQAAQEAVQPASGQTQAVAQPTQVQPQAQVQPAQTQAAQPQAQVQPQQQRAANPTITPSASDMLKRMLEKAENFKAMGQYILAEQMYVTYISRCPDNSSRADGELLMLDCRILAGNSDGAKAQLGDLLGKLRSGEYLLTQEQKKMLADCKIRLMQMAK